MSLKIYTKPGLLEHVLLIFVAGDLDLDLDMNNLGPGTNSIKEIAQHFLLVNVVPTVFLESLLGLKHVGPFLLFWSIFRSIFQAVKGLGSTGRDPVSPSSHLP